MQPKPGEVWRTNKGRVRFVKYVDGYGNIIYRDHRGGNGFASPGGWERAVQERGLRRVESLKTPVGD